MKSLSILDYVDVITLKANATLSNLATCSYERYGLKYLVASLKGLAADTFCHLDTQTLDFEKYCSGGTSRRTSRTLRDWLR